MQIFAGTGSALEAAVDFAVEGLGFRLFGVQGFCLSVHGTR